MYCILTIKKIKPKKIYNAYTTWFLTLSYLLLNAIVLVEFINKKEVSIFLLIIGLVIYLISVIYRRDAIETLGIYFRPDVSFITNHHLCTSERYATVRHPYYLGSLLEVVAIPIIFSSVWGILFCLCVNMPLLFMRIFYRGKSTYRLFW